MADSQSHLDSLMDLCKKYIKVGILVERKEKNVMEES
jgi:hypothetical protein